MLVDGLHHEPRYFHEAYARFPVTHIPPRDNPFPRQSFARSQNTGIAHARGDTVLLVCDYSWLHSDCLATHAELQAKHRGPVMLDYNYAKLPPSVTSANDAGAVYAILTEYLGVRQDNVIDLRDAKQADLNLVFGSLGVEGELTRAVRARPGARVLVYYSGYGATDSETGETYLLPVESEPFREALTGYRLSTLYANLAALGARSVLLVLETEQGQALHQIWHVT